MLLCAATLLLKLVVPTGYMIGSEDGRLAIILCPGTVPAATAMAMPGAHAGMPDHGGSRDHGLSRDHDVSRDHGHSGNHDHGRGHGGAEMPCAFSALSAAVLGPIDPIQLAALIAFVLAVGLTATLLPAPARPAFLRPPLRGPPAYP